MDIEIYNVTFTCFLLHFLPELVTQQRKFHIERFHNRAICLARSGDLKFMKLGMGQLAMYQFSQRSGFGKRGDVVLQHCWWGKGKASVNCVRIERKRGGSPQGTASLASQRKIPLAGQASHTLSFFCHNGYSCSVSLDLTDPDRLECLPVVGQGEEIVLFAVC